MGVRIRADLDEIPPYVAGRTIAGAINLASNEVSFEPVAAIVAAIGRAASTVNRYPSPFSDGLAAAVARRLGVGSDRIVIGCGSVSLCQQLVQTVCAPGDEVVFAWRSFEAYPIVARVAGAQPRTVTLTADLRHDLDATLTAITPSTRLVFVSNPHNPTGTIVRRDELERFLDAVPRDVLVVLDEAYREFVTDPDHGDGLNLAAERENVAVLRTFSKAYGLAGVRAGYCVASPMVAAGLRKVGVPFSVNRLAQAAALASLEVADELLARCAQVVVERERVRDELTGAGYLVPVSQANFVWLPLGERTAAFDRHLVSQGVVVRAFVPDGVRVTIGLPEENDAFLAVARTFVP